MQKTNLMATLSVNGNEGQSGLATSATSSIPLTSRCRAPSVGIDVDMVSEFDPSSSDSGVVSRCAVVKPLKLRLCRPIFGRKAIGKVKRDNNSDVSSSRNNNQSGNNNSRDCGTPVEIIKPVKPRDPEREKRRIARKKEKRATLILGLIMGSFIACWLPFFFLYIVKPLFPFLSIPGQTFVIAFWLGYMNSALNPVIYTVFNKDFRRAFRRILYKWIITFFLTLKYSTDFQSFFKNPRPGKFDLLWVFHPLLDLSIYCTICLEIFEFIIYDDKKKFFNPRIFFYLLYE